jgi:3-oxoacyl-[acyl-carrier-protein] synthase II
MELKRVVVTGLGALTPLGKTVDEYWQGLINGVSGAELITRFNTEKFKTKFACQIKNFNPEDYFDRKEARKLDLYTMYALIASDEALRNSGPALGESAQFTPSLSTLSRERAYPASVLFLFPS